MSKITVCFPIDVPNGKYCWRHNPPYEICSNFSNEGGIPSCDMGMGGTLKEEEGGVLKPQECLDLKPIGGQR